MEAGRDNEQPHVQTGASSRIRPTKNVLLIAAGCVIVILLVVIILVHHFVNNNEVRQASNANRSSINLSSSAQNNSTQTDLTTSVKTANHSVTVTGTIGPGLAACSANSDRLQIITTVEKVQYVIEADSELSVQLQSPQSRSRPIQVSGTVQSTLTVCSNGKNKSVSVLHVSKVELF